MHITEYGKQKRQHIDATIVDEFISGYGRVPLIQFDEVKSKIAIGETYVLSAFNSPSELSHHGILGQKWGERNGPPYPLDSSNHSASEKKAGWKKSLTKGRSVEYTKNRIVAGVSGNPNVGKSYNRIDKNMVKQINEPGMIKGGIDRQTNCTHCTTSYILNSVFGQNTTAKPYYGVDELDGSVSRYGRSVDLYDAMFDGVKRHRVNQDPNLVRTPWKIKGVKPIMESLPKNSTGIFLAANVQNGMGHVMCYEKDGKGAWTIVDAQRGEVYRSKFGLMPSYLSLWIPVEIFDFSEASINKSTEDSFMYKYIVEKG